MKDLVEQDVHDGAIIKAPVGGFIRGVNDDIIGFVGGRIEYSPDLGEHHPVYEYDISSGYPVEFKDHPFVARVRADLEDIAFVSPLVSILPKHSNEQ
jgi:hypothetical protein